MLLGGICKGRTMLHPECTKGRTDVNTVAHGTHSGNALYMPKNVVDLGTKTTLGHYANQCGSNNRSGEVGR